MTAVDERRHTRGFEWGSSTHSTGTVSYRRRRGGADLPLLALFHQSPLSGWTFEPLFTHLRYAGEVVALDTPGYGESPALPDARRVEDFVETLWATVQALRGERPLILLGQHTGARLALAIAAEHPDVVRRVIFQGLSLYTEEERQERSVSWAPPIEVRADGGHLLAYWERIHRLYPTASIEARNRSMRDYLAAAPDYAVAYRAVFAQDVNALAMRFAALNIPSHVLIGERDLLFPTQDRVITQLRSELISLPGLTDFAPLEDPHSFCAALDQILALETSPRHSAH